MDFYTLVETKSIPEHDVIVTNPPYSTCPRDHVHDLIRIVIDLQSPFFIVQPNYVYVKSFWNELTSKMLAPRPFFLTPNTPRRYKYCTPDTLREANMENGVHDGNDVQKNGKKRDSKTSPFVTFWYCWVGSTVTEQLYNWMAEQMLDNRLPLALACTEFFLPDAFKDSSDRTRRKKRKNRIDSDKSTLQKKRKRSELACNDDNNQNGQEVMDSVAMESSKKNTMSEYRHASMEMGNSTTHSGEELDQTHKQKKRKKKKKKK